MSRMINGDIEHQFWFALQSSNAASRFAKDVEYQPNYINYYFSEHHLPEVQKELKEIEEILGDKLDKLLAMKDNCSSKKLIENNINEEEVLQYADYLLGKKIEKCLIENGDCNFEAEL